jgi:hypothetical protein
VAEESGSVAAPAGKGVTRAQIERSRFSIRDYLLDGDTHLGRRVA